MKKLNFKKIVSAFLATVMLLAMIPVGAIVATAATENTDYVLGDNTITIMTVEGWNYVAANQSDYAAYTIKLGNDIDFKGSPTSLFKSTTFTGTFDGNSKTIYGNGGTSSRPYIPNTDVALIAATIDGATIKNVTIDGIGVKPADDANAYSIVVAEATGSDVTFTNISLKNQCYLQASTLTASKAVGFILGKSSVNVTVENITIANTTMWNSAGTAIYAGGVVGHMDTSGRSTFSDIKISDGLKINTRGYIGAVVGYSQGAGYFNIDNVRVEGELKNRANNEGSTTGIGGVIGAKRSATKAAGDSYVKNAYIDVNMYSGDKYSYCGGIIGTWYKDEDTSANLTIENCYVGGKYSAAKGGAFVDNVIGGVVGKFGSKNSEFTVKNVVVSVAWNQTWVDKPEEQGMTTVTTKAADVTTATANNWVVAVSWPSGGTKTKAMNLYTTLANNNSGATVISVANIATLVKTDSNGFITGVADSFVMGKMHAQVSDVVEGEYIIRFVIPVLELTDVDDIKMNIEVEGAGEDTLTTTINCTLYDRLTGYEGREKLTTYEPADYNAEKFLAGAITDVPDGTAYTFKITATYTLGGIAVTSTTYAANVDAGGNLVNNSN